MRSNRACRQWLRIDKRIQFAERKLWTLGLTAVKIMLLCKLWIITGFIGAFHCFTATEFDLIPPRLEFRRVTVNDEDDGNVPPTEKGPLFPVIFNLAANARATTNATCGQDRPEVYCKLVEHVLMKPPQCGICDASSTDPAQRHPVENAIDGSPRWWQSPSVANGNKYESVTITIDMRQRYQVAYIIVKAANSPRPAAWELSRSLDNVTFMPWQFFARTDEECQELFGLPGTMGRLRFASDDQVICTTDFSRIHPLEDGEIHASLINDRPGVDGPTQTLVDFTTARYIRMRFIKLHTLTADLIPLVPAVVFHDSSETRRYFYSIKDISIGGQCICTGHARDCPTDDDGIARCQCVHNTCGESCERCCPLFNQKPWKPGTAADHSVCEGCQCHGHAEECRYEPEIAASRQSISITGKYDGGGICVDCKHNTTGINCERCKDGFFRPLGVDKFNPIGCLLCECEGLGTTGQCIANEDAMFGELQPGDCVCLEGFGGPKCDHCAPGYRNFPKCEPCPCNYAGSKNGEACADDCRCKDNVEGAKCERCKDGFFNLDASNPLGCSPCFCFGVTDVCESTGWNASKIATLDGWILTDSTGSRILYPTYLNGTPAVIADDAYELDVFYWLAPKEYRGNRLVSYGGKLDYSITFIKGRGDLTGSYTADVDVVMEGNNLRIGKGERFFRESTPHHLSVHLQEQGWHHVTLNGIFGEVVTKEQFMTLLANVEKLMIRGTYHTRQMESRLLMVSVSQADPRSKEGLRLNSVERCTCPAGYAGLSCETCTDGYRRVNQTLNNGICVPCHCYAHATTCDAFTGECRDCQHNTAGFFCERCGAGYYGDAQSGDPNTCQPCGCPLLIATNNFSPTCVAGKVLTLPDDYVCTDCPVGYVGAKCEMCSDGYFGSPLVPGNFCQPCVCNGNVDLAALGNCERLTGECLKCIGNTEGFNCERCREGFFGSAIRHDCQACDCSPFGSQNSDCDHNTGQCICKPGYEGNKCDRCASGFGQISEGCLPCDCDVTGSISSECDPVSGQCECLPGVFGVHCRRCQEGFFGFSASGCQPCACEFLGSQNQTCEQSYGQCHCKANVTGRNCNHCQDLHYGITSGDGCKRCQCDPVGSLSASCDPLTGSCKCKQGVTGQNCNECDIGFYGFSDRGCTKCPACRVAGQVCDRETGECICPPNTVGDRCEACAVNSYDYHPMLGCKACNCSSVGATGPKCDLVTGKCQCRAEFEGNRCDQCHFGFYGFPDCEACGCDLSGTEMETCKNGKCGCDARTGQCACRKSVVGEQCNQCKPNTFSLDVTNPLGCTSCFCSGKTSQCYQAPYIWKISAHQGNKINFHYTDNNRRHPHHFNRSLAMDVVDFETTTITAPKQAYQTPCYWNLPTQFLGDRILSYNGKLKFRLDAKYHEDAHRHRGSLSGFPLALLQGNNRIILDYKDHREKGAGAYEVLFHESKWQNRQSPQFPVTRELLMVALQNVQHFIIRGNTLPFPVHMEIKDVELEFAGPGSARGGKQALGVEMCQCPTGYNGTSCQNPSSGYYRKHALDFLDNPDHLKLLGDAVPCECYGHSKECDVESGRCRNCQDNSAGDHCDRCVKGFYGDAKQAGLDSCKRCACPSLSHSYSETCSVFRNNGKQDYICDACRPGFTGDKCEQCEKGYYGNPTAGIPCQPCQCNPWGSVTGQCNALTGQCQCRGGLLGRDCSKCQVGHVITSAGCINCMHDHCIKTLMEEFIAMDVGLESFNSTGLTRDIQINKAPLTRLTRLQDRYEQLSIVVQGAIGESAAFMESIFPELESQFDFDREIRRLMLTANKSANVAIGVKNNGATAGQVITQVCADIPAIEAKIQQLVRNLRDYVMSEDTQGTLNVGVILSAAESILTEISNNTYRISNGSAVGSLSAVRAVLAEIESLDSSGDLVSSARSRYRDIRRKIEELENFITSDIDTAVRLSRRVSATTARKVGNIQQRWQAIKAANETAQSTITKIQQLRQTASQNYRNATRTFEEAQTTSKDFRVAMDSLQNISGILENLNPLYRDTVVLPAQEHSLELTAKADMLAEHFVKAKSGAQDPLRAARVYSEIVDKIQASSNETESARETNEAILGIVFPQADRDLGFSAREVVNKSQELEDMAGELLEEDVISLQERVEEETGRLTGISAINQRTEAETDSAADRLDALPTDLSDRIAALNDTASALLTSVDASFAKTDRILTDINTKLRPRFEQKGIDPVSFNQTSRSVRELKSNIARLDQNTTALENMAKTLEELHREMASKIHRLRNVIHSAKQAASTLQLSLAPDANGICRRSYEPPIIPGAANTITLSYSTTMPERNALLMYIGNPRSLALEPDFMAVELVDRRVRFIWNVGSDTKVLQHPEAASAPQSAFIQPNTWYKIEIYRVKNTAHMSVLPMTEAQKSHPTFINGSSNSGFTRMDLNRSSEMFVGGLPNSVDIPEILSREYFGCLGGIAIDGQQIGLWNYKTNQGCSGCATSELEGGGDVGSFRFNGNGYASVPQVRRYDNKRYSITLTFRTFDENALLVLCANNKEPNGGDFISLELRDGYIVFQFYLGGQNHLLLSTSRRFNTGNFVTVSAERKDIVAELRAGDDKITASLPATKPDGLELAGHPVFFGGVPPGFTFLTKYNITLKPFIGCISDIQVDITPMDLLAKNVYHVDVEQGCKTRAIRDVSFKNSAGYLKLPGRTLPIEFSISFSFATGQADGLLFAAVSNNYKKDMNYWTASLQTGRMVLRFNSGEKEVKLEVDRHYDDRVLHTVSVRKRKRKIVISVDDHEVKLETGKLDKDTGISAPIVSNVIFVGGGPSDVDLSGIAASARSFVGCITGLIINGELVGFEQLESFDRAAIGRCEFDAMPTGLEPPLPELLPPAMALSRQPRNCAPSPKLTKTPPEWHALSFGSTENSHVQLTLSRKDTKLFNLTFILRTFHKNGLVLYTENPQGDDYLLVSLRGGRAVISINDEYPQEAFSQAGLADGLWHEVSLERKARRMTLKIDDKPPEFIKLSKRFSISGSVSVAGTGRELKLPSGQNIEGFRGCLGNFTWNEKTLNLREEKSVHGVAPCYMNVEPAAFFEGNGYATYQEHFQAHGKLQIEMDFRTNSLTGELVLLYDPLKRLFAQIKFIDSQVIFNISSYTESFHAIKAFPVKHRLCDGEWHRVKALFLKNVITIDVDDLRQEYAYAHSQAWLELPDNVPLYVGGRPASVPAHIIPKVPNFVGCIRNLSVNGLLVDFALVSSLRNVLLDSCPVAA